MKLPTNIAQDVGVSVNYIHKINNGSRQPGIKLVPRIIEALAARGIKADWQDLRPDIFQP